MARFQSAGDALTEESTSTRATHRAFPVYQAYGDDWEDADARTRYAESQKPCLYDDFFDVAAQMMTQDTRAEVRKALDFHFTRRPAKGFPKKRLALIEQQVRQRAHRLLGTK